MKLTALKFLLANALAFSFTLGASTNVFGELLSRKQWNAADSKTELMNLLVKAKEIAIHHSGTGISTRHSPAQKMKYLQEFSFSSPEPVPGKKRKPVWGDVPYHFYIFQDGTIAEGRPLTYRGDSNTKADYTTAGKINIAIEGNFNTIQPTLEQLSVLKVTIKRLMAQFDISIENVNSHRGFGAQTFCPGKNLAPHLDTIINDLADDKNHQYL